MRHLIGLGLAFKLAAAALATTSTVDVIQTTGCVSRGICREQNPLIRPVAASRPIMVAVKGGIDGSVILAAWKLHRDHSKAAWALLGSVLVAQSAAVVWNAKH